MAHLHGWQVGAGYWWEVSVPLHSGAYTELLVWCLHYMMTGIFQREQSKRARQKWHIQPPLGSHTLSLCNVLITQICLIQCGRGLPRGRNARRGGIIGSHLGSWLPELLSFIFHSTHVFYSFSFQKYISDIITYLHLYCL